MGVATPIPTPIHHRDTDPTSPRSHKSLYFQWVELNVRLRFWLRLLMLKALYIGELCHNVTRKCGFGRVVASLNSDLVKWGKHTVQVPNITQRSKRNRTTI